MSPFHKCKLLLNYYMLITNNVQYTCCETYIAKGEFGMLYLCAGGGGGYDSFL